MMVETTQLAGRAMASGPEGRDLRGVLFERIMTRIHRYFQKMVRDRSAVDDCVQQTLLRLERSLQDGTYDPRRSFNRWMWIKAHSVWVDHCRKADRRARPAGDHLPDDPTGSPVGEVDARLDARAILDHLRESLDPETFAIFVLVRAEETSITETAAIVERARKTVRKKLDRANREALRFLDESPSRMGDARA